MGLSIGQKLGDALNTIELAREDLTRLHAVEEAILSGEPLWVVCRKGGHPIGLFACQVTAKAWATERRYVVQSWPPEKGFEK